MIPLYDQRSVEVSLGGYTTKGVKEENQDAFAAKQPESIGVRHTKGIVACIADGVSVCTEAQKASTTSVTTFIEDYYSTPETWSIRQAAARVLNSLNSWLFYNGQQGNDPGRGLVTTFSGIVFKSNTAHLVHVGDSRIYRYREGELICLTRDHVHKSGGDKSFLVRAMGMDNLLEVDYQAKNLHLNDVYLLSTDGLHEFVSSSEMQACLASDENLETAAKSIVDRALANGSDDNVSCLLVKIDHLPTSDIDEVHRQLTQLVIPPVLKVGHKLDNFEILRVVHNGTRSHVYLAQSKVTKKQYILKAPSENFSEDAQYLEGFIREEWVGRRINHPLVMKIYPRPQGSPFLYHVCEYIPGVTLRQWMFDNPSPSLAKVRLMTESIIKAIRVLQRGGMVHRDLKPENVLVDTKGHAHLIDFGTIQVDSLDEIKSPLAGEVPVGSLNYIAPEYLLGNEGYHYSDIFSLGVMVYEMLTGKLPYKTSDSQQWDAQKHQSWDYIPASRWRSDVPRWLDLTLEKACHASVEKRYHVLSEFLTDLSSPNAELIRRFDAQPLIKRNPLLVWKSISALLLVLLLIESWYLSRYL